MLSKSTKKFAITVLIFAALVGSFVFFGGSKNKPKKSSSTSGLTTTSGDIVPGGGDSSTDQSSVDEFAVVLSTIQNITIDTSIFQDKAYLSLRDNPIQLGVDTVGRTNPFAPIGTDPAGPISNTLTVSTIQPGKITSTSAEFGAQISITDTQPITLVFEYGTSDTFGNTTTPVNVTHSGSTFVPVTNLTPGTTYYVRAVGAKGSVTTPANIMNFTTAQALKH